MKFKLFPIVLLVILSCTDGPPETATQVTKVEPDDFLEFDQLKLKNLEAFREPDGNWQIGGKAFADRNQERHLEMEAGTGVLVNLPKEGMKSNLFTRMEHGDMELEIDIMMPKGSNSGLYFQGRYEIQLLDSWGVEKLKHGDMGGIYQRWNREAREGEQGYEGKAPLFNAAKAPGLWQHFKILFKAPKFDENGSKIENARFEEVWLNGNLIHENQEVTGPTRAAAFGDETALGPFMIQGDHGPVAIKNFRYKTYDGKEVLLSNLTMAEYEYASVEWPDFNNLEPLREIETDSVSATMVTGRLTQRILKYQGMIEIPEAGEYLIDYRVRGTGGLMVVGQDTLVDLSGRGSSNAIVKKNLEKGTYPITLLYNKHSPWARGFSLEVEGPKMQKQALTAKNSLFLDQGRPEEDIMVKVEEEAVTQRSFIFHRNSKRTHCISVGTPAGIHYAYDLAFGSLLQAWDGEFLNTTPMWHARGNDQLGIPAGFKVSFHGDPEFVQLEDQKAVWPRTLEEKEEKKFLGYELDGNGVPVFSHSLAGSVITDKTVPSESTRGLERIISIDAKEDLWFKLAEGESIDQLPDGSFLINDESYFLEVSDEGNLKPVIRESGDVNELVMAIPPGEHTIAYEIIW